MYKCCTDSKFLSWLQKETGVIASFGLILLVVFLDFLSAFIITATWPEIHNKVSEIKIHHSLDLMLPVILAFGALSEEAVFRLFPLGLAVNVWGASYKVIAVALISSAIFGVLHGNLYNIFYQGVGGLLYSLVFLKCGGMNRNYGKAVCCSTGAHFTFNASIFLILAASGVRNF
jgi:membrane protease YdiL (CAAX protease family)